MLSYPRTAFKRSKYRLLGLVGQGQFGQVFCAVHRRSGRLVALKNLEHQRFPTHKFLRELRFLLSLQHPNIVTFHALEHTPTGRYLVMDYCEGGTLRSLMTEDSCLTLPQGLKLVADILRGLEHAHSRGIVHCDIKPENILLTLQPAGWKAQISDFGIARLSQELLEQEWGNTGSPAYMAPERFYGQYSPTSDLYSVGIILFELLAGHRPFSGTPAQLMSAHLNRSVQLPDSVPEVWRSCILTALQKLSGRRFRSATEMQAALRSAAAQAGISLDPPSVAPPLRQAEQIAPCLGKYEQQEPLQQRVDCVAGVLDGGAMRQLSSTPIQHLYRAQETYLTWTTLFPPAPMVSDRALLYASKDPLSWEKQFRLPTAIRELFCRPQGCFVIAQDGVYLLLREGSLQRIADLAATAKVAVEERGRWLTIASSGAAGTTITFKRLAESGRSISLADRPIQLATRGKNTRLLQVICLDSRHIAVLFTVFVNSAHTSGQAARLGTRLEILTRRGDRVGSLAIPIAIDQAVPTFTPYRLLATEQNTQTLVLIDLKPLRISRLNIEITPAFLTASPWGYSATDAQGQMVFLDLSGQRLGQMQSFACPTSIAPIQPYGFWVATWDDHEGSLYRFDLRSLDIDLLI